MCSLAWHKHSKEKECSLQCAVVCRRMCTISLVVRVCVLFLLSGDKAGIRIFLVILYFFFFNSCSNVWIHCVCVCFSIPGLYDAVAAQCTHELGVATRGATRHHSAFVLPLVCAPIALKEKHVENVRLTEHWQSVWESTSLATLFTNNYFSASHPHSQPYSAPKFLLWKYFVPCTHFLLSAKSFAD